MPIRNLPLLLLLSQTAPTGPTPVVAPPPAEACSATIATADADRFAALFARTGGKPTAAQVQAEYLDPGSYAVRVTMAPRIGGAAAMARAIAAKPDLYASAISDCLPVARSVQRDLRLIYARYAALFPDKRLPQVFLVFGSGNTGGTADGVAQVLGLEVMCTMAPSPDTLRDTLRIFLARETVQAMQNELKRAEYERSPLLASVLMEGAADLLALEVTGRQPDPARAWWAKAHATELMERFRTTSPPPRAGRSRPRRRTIRVARSCSAGSGTMAGRPPAGQPRPATGSGSDSGRRG